MNLKKYLFVGVALAGWIAIFGVLNWVSVQDKVWVDGLLWGGGLCAMGGVLKAIAPRHAHIGLLGLVLAWLVTAAGVAESLVVMAWLLSAWAIGAWLLQYCQVRSSNPVISSTEALVLGCVAWLSIWGVMIHFPINRPGVYLGMCLLSLLALARVQMEMAGHLRSRAAAFQHWMQSIPFWYWAAGLALAGWTLRWSSFPTLFYDDHAYHLRLWTELLTRQRALFDVQSQIWAVAPFAIDLLHAGLSLMAFADARSAMNLALGIMLLVLVARILHRLSLPSWVQWLLLCLMASTPMLGNLLLSLQTELLLAVVALAGLRLAIDAEGGWRGSHVLGILACSALCAAIKLPGAVLGVALLAALAVRWWCQRAEVPTAPGHLRWHACWLLVPIVFVALHSYAWAWQLTGNPVFPLYNAIFLSPLAYPENFSDMQWVHGFSLWNYVRAFFQTSKFFEGGDYTAGWQYLFLLPLCLAALWRQSVPAGLKITAVPVLGFGLVMFAVTQYWRYLFPAMPMAVILMAALFVGKNRYLQAFALVAALACTVANLWFFPKASWTMRSPAQAAYWQQGKEELVRLHVPVVHLTQEVNRLAPGSRVLYPPELPQGATLHGTPVYATWYSPFRERRFLLLADAEGMRRFLDDEKLDFALLNMGTPKPYTTPVRLLREHLAQYGTVVAQQGALILYRLGDVPLLYRQVFDLRAAMREPAETTPLLLPASPAGVEALPQPRVLAKLDTGRASQLRYSARLRCPSAQGVFVAQINWDQGDPYYRLVDCQAQDFSFVEAAAIPYGARQGWLYLDARDAGTVVVEELSVDVR